jgi:phosphate transport system permease protein
MKTKADIIQSTGFLLVRTGTLIVIVSLLLILGFIFYKGYSAISWEFLTKMPEKEMTAGGIFPAILGTFYLMLGSSVISIPVGVITAIYLTEYAKSPKIVKIIRLVIITI